MNDKIKPAHFSGLFFFLASQAPRQIFVSILLSIMSGIAYSFLIPLVLMSVQSSDDFLLSPAEDAPVFLWDFEVYQPDFALAFASLCVFILITRSAAQIMFSRVVVASSCQLRIYLCRRINQMPIANLEKIGQPELTTSLTSDIPALISGASVYPQLFTSISTLFGIFGFLLVLNLDVFILVLTVILFGIITYRLPVMLSNRYFTFARTAFSKILADLSGVVLGAKELKLNPRRREDFMQKNLVAHVAHYRKQQTKALSVTAVAVNYGSMISFFAIGILTYIISSDLDLSKEILVGTIMALLYAVGPIGVIMNLISSYQQGNVALKRMRRLLGQMPVEAESSMPVKAFDTIRLEQICYEYDRENGFTVGPVDLSLKSGEVTFLVGGNGSGKSTLAKIITCHYLNSRGRLLFDDQAIDATNISGARTHISAIYTDFHLFTRLYGLSGDEVAKAGQYLELLQLSDKVSIVDNGFSSIHLSDGQKKRLALVVAYLDDTKVYLFDEWAADQDPQFKAFFYQHLLPDLKAKGKIVIVISHDDQYFDTADQVVKLGEGRILNISRPAGENLPPGMKTAGKLDTIAGAG
ncbi:cyclic peptide export ABC transporter [Thalassomonas viridans]|uniref:Cyclic peptide export ABC transporter n=1 Tax=Thalassomonas viridans TaxID=137584 RepID=A0AAE9Z9J9_9GAMM|nr:cyclic peptide export ABC transporter [Thalassomonas viridans]WDE09266.1 cyclic peptide export ABC transporter [Thalassomonas viridans]